MQQGVCNCIHHLWLLCTSHGYFWKKCIEKINRKKVYTVYAHFFIFVVEQKFFRGDFCKMIPWHWHLSFDRWTKREGKGEEKSQPQKWTHNVVHTAPKNIILFPFSSRIAQEMIHKRYLVSMPPLLSIIECFFPLLFYHWWWWNFIVTYKQSEALKKKKESLPSIPSCHTNLSLLMFLCTLRCN